jgi:4-hydroxy-tetrahydrodipicolinate synthase
MKVTWNGVFPAATTQFRDDQSLDLLATARHLDRLIEAGVHGLIVLGTVGENTSLEADEKLAVLKAALDVNNGRVPVLTGVAEFSTAAACRYAHEAEMLGADGLMVLPAMVYKADRREAIAHFRAVARSANLPIMCYNNPPSYGVDLTPEAFVELADEPNLVAVKESSDDVRRITDLFNATGDRYIIFGGVDDLVLESAVLGAVGTVSGLVNAFPHETLKLWELISTDQYDEARKLYRWFTPLLHLDTHPKLVQYIKLVAAECGLGTETVRAPRLPLAGEERERIVQLVRDALRTRP